MDLIFRNVSERATTVIISTQHDRGPLCRMMERVAGIEPAWPAWKAGTLPLSYTRETSAELCAEVSCSQRLSFRLANLRQQVHADGAIKREVTSPGDQQ